MLFTPTSNPLPIFQRQPRRAIQTPICRLGFPPPRVLVLDSLVRQSRISLSNDDALFEGQIEWVGVPLCHAGNAQATYRNETRSVLPRREQGRGRNSGLLL